ncbi:hypothetical protein D3C76_258630 [compost metagenome]
MTKLKYHKIRVICNTDLRNESSTLIVDRSLTSPKDNLQLLIQPIIFCPREIEIVIRKCRDTFLS